jgi:hypothetical protein
MTAAIIGAIGVITVALIGVIAGRIESNDKRTRLTKDVEILSKLDESSAQYSELKASIDKSLASMLRNDKLRDSGAAYRNCLVQTIVFAVIWTTLAYALWKYDFGQARGQIEILFTIVQIWTWVNVFFLAFNFLFVMVPTYISVSISDTKHAKRAWKSSRPGDSTTGKDA